MSNQRTYNTYRLTFPEFVYESYKYDVQSDGLHISFRFKLNDKIVFCPTAFIPRRDFINFDLPQQLLNLLVFNIGMVELISYWKAYCSPTVRIVPHGLTTEAIAFWKKLYFNGLGEFFYINGIHASEEDFMTIVAEGKPLESIKFCAEESAYANGFLVPIGGGKDSVVSIELIKEMYGESNALPLVMNPRGATIDCCRVAGFERKDFFEIQRTIDPLLLDLNAKGALNGHTPFSAMLAFYTLLAAALTGRSHIALSNESSANEATVLIGDSKVNHQYSKSLEFENDFRNYVAKSISPWFDYFSLLRPLSELQIAMLFSRLPQYHNVFRSCNVGSKQDIWCCHCAKCLFAFIILSPFINPVQLTQVFGNNLLDMLELKKYFEQLTGFEPTKPFECVGTVSEVNTALRMTIEYWYKDERPALLKDFTTGNYDVPLHELDNNHNLSVELFNLLKSHVV